ncbi:MAG: hypothetical protein JKY57_02595 [Kordiimonadaceae bacterium]|nr:hypothetical protein [Kordiimonadaceae bacterium]
MLKEAFIWSTSQSCQSARAAGLVSEAAGIAGRYKRHSGAWTEHLTKTKSFIESHLHLAVPDKPILILGAGLCLDLPLPALNSHKAGAVLMDAVFTLSSRLTLMRYTKIATECSDITGILKPFWNTRKEAPVTPPATAPIDPDAYGMIVSCNLLSQLPLSFTDCPPADDSEIKLTTAIQLAHMKALHLAHCPVLLISDYERIETCGEDRATHTSVAPHILPDNPLEEWTWPIAPKGEIGHDIEIRLKVRAWLLGSG